MVDIPGRITYAQFGDDRLRGLWVAGSQILPIPIDFECRPYNTLALPSSNRRNFDRLPIKIGVKESNAGVGPIIFTGVPK